jgi:3D (Asp-Asp-Asp) domain-containing protein
MYKLTEPQKELGVLAAVLAILGIAILVFQFQQANQPEPPDKPREKNKLNPTFYSVEYFNEYLPKPEDHDTNKINNYIVEDTDEGEVMKVEEKKELVSRGSQETYESFGVEATAYTAFCNSGCIGIVATGYDVSNTIYYKGNRIVASDPSIIPMHSIVKVEYGDVSFLAHALDTGGAIKGYKIDLLVETKREAIEFGRKTVQITIMKNGKDS